jgi:CDP-diacylglycerol--inositol 3-phosphatidyltransferase
MIPNTKGSRFGAVLDMVTDRSTTTCLLGYLCVTYPRHLFWFQCLMALDLSSHYMQMNSSLVCGATSHKSIDKTENTLLRLYYTDRRVLFLVCAGNELFYILLYLVSFDSLTGEEQDIVWDMSLMTCV